MSDDTVIGCVRVDDTSHYIVANSVEMPCECCGAGVWVSPTGRQIIAEHGAVPTCMECLEQRVEDDGEPELMLPTPEQWAEVRQHLAGYAAWKRRN